nr:transporter [Geotalea sp. SG265]
MAAGTAHAEHKLLVTDVLDAKELEGQATFEYAHSTRKIKEAGETIGKERATEWASTYSLNVGLGHGLELDASIPYVFSERESKTGFEPEKRDGVGDFSFGAKYALVKPEKEQPFGLVIGTDVKFDTAGPNNAGTQTTAVSPYIAGSQKVNEHLTPYAIYRATLQNNGGEDSHDLALGVEAEVNHNLTFDARFDAIFGTGTVEEKASERYRLELASYIQLFHNFYLIPAVSVVTGSPVDIRETKEQLGSPKTIAGAVSLYYLF